MDKYQKIKDLGLEIRKYTECLTYREPTDVFYIKADDLLKVLDAGVEVYSKKDCRLWHTLEAPENANRAILINIKPLKPKEVTITREDLKTAFSDGLGIVDISYFDVIARRLGL